MLSGHCKNKVAGLIPSWELSVRSSPCVSAADTGTDSPETCTSSWRRASHCCYVVIVSVDGCLSVALRWTGNLTVTPGRLGLCLQYYCFRFVSVKLAEKDSAAYNLLKCKNKTKQKNLNVKCLIFSHSNVKVLLKNFKVHHLRFYPVFSEVRPRRTDGWFHVLWLSDRELEYESCLSVLLVIFFTVFLRKLLRKITCTSSYFQK